MQKDDLKQFDLPDESGVYMFRNAKRKILYIGKAGNLKRRVSSYFIAPHDSRIQKMVSEIVSIQYKKTDTALEALILEATLIKKHEPLFNIREKDDKSFLYVEKKEENRINIAIKKKIFTGAFNTILVFLKLFHVLAVSP